MSKSKDKTFIGWYRNHWFHLTMYVFMLLAFFMCLWGNNLTEIQHILMMSFMALFAHQFEEYVLPGGGPVVINKGNFDEKEHYRNFPGNMHSAMIVNNSAYLVYLLALIFPQFIWLGLGTMFFNLFQLVGHGIKMNRGMKTWYNPGLGTTIVLLVPISIYYITYIVNHQLVSGWDWFGGAITFILATLITTILPVQLLKDINSPYVVPEYQIECCDKVQAFASLHK